MRRFRRFWIGAFIAAAAIAAPAAGALAASAPAAHAAAHGTTALRAAGNPAGCGTGNFCSYRYGNGGGICYNNHFSSISSWSSSCRTVDSVYNNGAAAGPACTTPPSSPERGTAWG